MSGAHLHIILNHFPVVLSYFGLLCLALSLLLRSTDLRRVALGTFVLIALLTVPVYLTGGRAEHTVEELPGVSHEVIERHERLAKVALTSTIVLGLVAAIGLLGERRRGSMPKGFPVAVFLVGLAAAGILAFTANLGGKIRRPEIRVESGSLPSESGNRPVHPGNERADTRDD